MEEPFTERLRRLVREHGTSQERVFNDAYDPSTPRNGTSPAQLKKVMRGERQITPHAIEAVARALGIAPEEFPEYRLALARTQLDENEVGLDQALANLERIETAMQTRPRQKSGREASPAEASPGPRQAGGRASRTRKAG